MKHDAMELIISGGCVWLGNHYASLLTTEHEG